MSEAFDRRTLLVRGGRLAAGAGAALALPGWVAVGSRSSVDARVAELAGLVQGPVVTPADPTYDSARRLYSPRYDDVRPGAIAFCQSPQDVWRTVRGRGSTRSASLRGAADTATAATRPPAVSWSTSRG